MYYYGGYQGYGGYPYGGYGNGYSGGTGYGAAIILVLIPTVIGAYVSIMIAKPGFEAIWNGSCDIF